MTVGPMTLTSIHKHGLNENVLFSIRQSSFKGNIYIPLPSPQLPARVCLQGAACGLLLRPTPPPFLTNCSFRNQLKYQKFDWCHHTMMLFRPDRSLKIFFSSRLSLALSETLNFTHSLLLQDQLWNLWGSMPKNKNMQGPLLQND